MSTEPLPLLLWCPMCHVRHIDEGENATREHRTHACQACGFLWAPAVVPTVGVQFLPGCKNDAVVSKSAGSADRAARILIEAATARERLLEALDEVDPNLPLDELARRVVLDLDCEHERFEEVSQELAELKGSKSTEGA